jgi:hypothetical protein
VLSEISAKLTALIIQRWLVLVSCWRYPDRSLVKASATVRSYALLLVSALAGAIDLTVALEQIQRCMQSGYLLNQQRKHPNTYQFLLDLSLLPKVDTEGQGEGRLLPIPVGIKR